MWLNEERNVAQKDKKRLGHKNLSKTAIDIGIKVKWDTGIKVYSDTGNL